MIIKKKIWKEYFEKVASGEKRFEIRLADFDIQKGNTMLLEEWDAENEKYTGRNIEVDVSYVIKTKDLVFWEKSEIDKYGYQVIQIELKNNKKNNE